MGVGCLLVDYLADYLGDVGIVIVVVGCLLIACVLYCL